MKFILALALLLILSACGKSSDNGGAIALKSGDSQNIKAVWSWKSGNMKMRNIRATSETLDLTGIGYGVLAANSYYEFQFANSQGDWGPTMSARGDFTFQDPFYAWIDYANLIVMDCGLDLNVPCDQAPNAPMANQGGPWDGNISYYSDGATLTLCFDDACGVFTK